MLISRKILISLAIFFCAFPLMTIAEGNIRDFRFGINIYYFILLLISALILYSFVFSKKREYEKFKSILFSKKDKRLRFILLFLCLFSLYAVISAFINPVIFEGIHVISPRGGMGADKSVLSFTMSNTGQAAYLALNFLFVLFSLREISSYELFQKYMLRFFEITIYTLIVFSVWQVVSKWFGIYYPNDYLFNMLDRGEVNQTASGFFRINGPMREPSDLGRILVSFFSFSTICIFKCRSKTKYTIISLVLMSLIFMSTSSVGILVLAIFLITLSLIYIYKLINGTHLLQINFVYISALLFFFW